MTLGIIKPACNEFLTSVACVCVCELMCAVKLGKSFKLRVGTDWLPVCVPTLDRRSLARRDTRYPYSSALLMKDQSRLVFISPFPLFSICPYLSLSLPLSLSLSVSALSFSGCGGVLVWACWLGREALLRFRAGML